MLSTVEPMSRLETIFMEYFQSKSWLDTVRFFSSNCEIIGCTLWSETKYASAERWQMPEILVYKSPNHFDSRMFDSFG